MPEVAHSEITVKSLYSGLSSSVFTEKCSKSTPADSKKQEKDRKEESVGNLNGAVQRIWDFEGNIFLVQNMLQRSHKCWIRTQFRGRLWKHIRKRGKKLPQKDEEEDACIDDLPVESDSNIMWDREWVQISHSSNQSWASFHKRQTNT